MFNRTYGWVQNPADFRKLKKVTQIFDNKSSHYNSLKTDLVNRLIAFDDLRSKLKKKLDQGVEVFSYQELVGTSKGPDGKNARCRGEAVADGLIQITLLPQNFRTTGKEWTDNWTSDGYLRWALSLNFVKHNRESDDCSITPWGLEYARCVDGSNEETEILRTALLRYPPATRVLKILDSSTGPATKYHIGERLGFKGEKGFTSYPDSLMKDWYANADRDTQKKIKSDIEGTSDKYARMISGWLEKVGFVSKRNTTVETTTGLVSGFSEYSITAQGKHALNQSEGSSKNKAQEKFLTWEFLAIEGKNRDRIRTRRAYVLKELKATRSLGSLIKRMADKGFENPHSIRRDIEGLNAIGIRIEVCDNSVVLKDKIEDFSIPPLLVTKKLKDTDAEIRKTRIMEKTDLPLKYYELMDIAYDGSRNRDFEIMTMDLLTNIYGFDGKLLGGGSKPDGIVFTDQFGIIVDTKAYGNGYSKNLRQEDEMVRYVEDNLLRDDERNKTEWWKGFNKKTINRFYFMWISSYFSGQFADQLKSASHRTQTQGAALNVEQLLIEADLARRGKLKPDAVERQISNKEINWKTGD